MAQTYTEFCDQERALLLNRLQFPLIARDYMDAGAPLEDDARYALHEMLGDLSPPMALLCAAATLQDIALSHEGLTYLRDVCGRILHTYGADALEGKEPSLSPLLEDLEQILELMEMCRMSFEIVQPETLVFINILMPQINAQIMIVEQALAQRWTDTPAHKTTAEIVEFPVTA